MNKEKKYILTETQLKDLIECKLQYYATETIDLEDDVYISPERINSEIEYVGYKEYKGK